MLKNDYLNNEDIIGKQKYSDATGKVSVGTIINIKKIDFFGLTLYNVKASIVYELSAPLLLGQTAMAKLGKFIFDPVNGKLIILDGNEYNNEIKTPISNIQKPKIKTLPYGTVMEEKVASLSKTRATASKSATGLEYAIVKGTGAKPADGTTVYVHYAGYLEDGSLFDSSYEEVNRTYGKFDQKRASQNGYQPFPFQIGNKGGLIPGFLEGVSLLSFGDKATFYIPSKLGYGERGAGNVIPPNSNIIFEVEIFETQPAKK